MKLLGFEGHEITSMHYELIDENELQKILEESQIEEELQIEEKNENIYTQEDIQIKITNTLNKSLIIGDLIIVDIEGYRKITLTIVGEFLFDNENESNPHTLSDMIFTEFWPMLRKYIPPAVSTLTSITNRGELELKF